MIRELLKTKIGFYPPNALCDIVSQFASQYNGVEKGLNMLIHSYLEGTFYTSVPKEESEFLPIEIQPFLAIHERYGYLWLAPELETADYPIVSFEPAGGYISFCGNSTVKGIEFIIAWVGSDVDNKFLTSINIEPQKAHLDQFQSVNYNPNMPEKLPIVVPEGYNYLPTSDGVGVMARKEHFSSHKIKYAFYCGTVELLNYAKKYYESGHIATSLVYLKEAWLNEYSKFNSTYDLLKEIKKLKIDIYRELGRNTLANKFIEKFEFIDTMKTSPNKENRFTFLRRLFGKNEKLK